MDTLCNEAGRVLEMVTGGQRGLKSAIYGGSFETVYTLSCSHIVHYILCTCFF